MKILIFMMGCFISFGALAGGHEQNEKHKSPYSKNALIKMAKKAAPSSITDSATFMDFDASKSINVALSVIEDGAAFFAIFISAFFE